MPETCFSLSNGMEENRIRDGQKKNQTVWSLQFEQVYYIQHHDKKKEKRHTEGYFRAHFSTMFANRFLFVLHAKQIAQKKKGFHSTCDMGFLENILVMICTIFLKLWQKSIVIFILRCKITYVHMYIHTYVLYIIKKKKHFMTTSYTYNFLTFPNVSETNYKKRFKYIPSPTLYK